MGRKSTAASKGRGRKELDNIRGLPENRTIGIFTLGTRNVKLQVNEFNGGTFDCNPDVAEITIGINKRNWVDVLNYLVHESWELAAMELGCRFTPNPDFSASSDGFIFVMTHTQMSEITARTAWFLNHAIPALRKAYIEFHKEKRHA